MTDSANTPLTDEADQAHAGHISMFIDVLSTEEQQYKKEDALVTTITFEETKTDPNMVKQPILIEVHDKIHTHPP